MASKSRTWKCQRVSQGQKCGTVNKRVKQKCVACGGPRPKRQREAHFSLLDLPYEFFVLVNGGSEDCGVCGRPPRTKKNDRDHEHADGGIVRGLLCHACNRAISQRTVTSARMAGMTLPQYLRAQADYLERAERWRGVNLEAFL